MDPLITGVEIAGAHERVQRSDKHRADLEESVRRFVQGELGPVPQEPQLNAPHHRRHPAWSLGLLVGPRDKFGVGDEAEVAFFLDDRDFAARWGAILGDWIHCLRTAIDNVAWGATVAFQATLNHFPPPRPFPRGSPWREVAFPTARTSNEWQSARHQHLWGVHPKVLAFFERFQPFQGGQATPEDHPLYVLRELSNIDKHHGVHFLATKMRIQAVEVPAGTLFVPKESWELETGAVVATLKFLTSDAVALYPDKVQVEFAQSFDIAFGKGTPAEGRGVWETMDAIRREVGWITMPARWLGDYASFGGAPSSSP